MVQEQFWQHTQKHTHTHTPAEPPRPACPPGLQGSLAPPVVRRGLSCCRRSWGWSCAGCCCHCPTRTDWGRQSPRPPWQAAAAAAAPGPSGLPAGSPSEGCTASGRWSRRSPVHLTVTQHDKLSGCLTSEYILKRRSKKNKNLTFLQCCWQCCFVQVLRYKMWVNVIFFVVLKTLKINTAPQYQLSG